MADHAGTNDEVWPGPETVRYLFPGTKQTAGDTIQVTWYDGGLKPSADLLVVDGKKVLPEEKKLPGAGSVFIGEEGVMVLPHYADPQLYPIEKYEGKALPDVQGTNHWHDWVDAVLAGKRMSRLKPLASRASAAGPRRTIGPQGAAAGRSAGICAPRCRHRVRCARCRGHPR